MKRLIRSKRFLLLTLAVVVVAVLWLTFRNDSKPAPTQNQPTAVQVTPSGLKYPAGWTEAPQISSADKNAGVVSEASRQSPSGSAILLVKATREQKNTNMSKLSDDIVSQLRQNVASFELGKVNQTNIGNNKAIDITYTDSGGKHRQFIVPTTNRSFYLTISAASGDFSRVNQDSEKFINALADYIASH